MKIGKNKLISYKEYLQKMNKKELMTILDTFVISYNTKDKVSTLITLILNDLDDILKETLSYFTTSEYQYLKYIIKKKGYIKLKSNVGLMLFCEKLTNLHFMNKISDNKYVLFKEVYKVYKIKIKQKKIIKKCQKNTQEWHLILGSTLAYGSLNFNDFYHIYLEKYQISEKDLQDYLYHLKSYSNAFNLYKEKDNLYLANKNLKNIKECQKYANYKDKKSFSFKELQNLYTLKYLKKYKSYHKLQKFITDNYYVDKKSFNIVSEKVIIPYLEEYQIEKRKAYKILPELINKFFEFNTNKLQTKFMELITSLAKDFPNWNLKGYSEREKEK